jgi:arylsulfatase A-like enzyme
MSPARSLWIAALVAAGLLVPALPPRPALGQPERPNVLIIVTDDQRTRSLEVMPSVRRWFGEGGRAFRNAFATTPLCCPSRASFMTGRYAHNHGVLNNMEAEDLDEAETLQSYLQGVGYRTAIAGKYLNRWPLTRDPEFFNRFAVFNKGYASADWNVDGHQRTIERYSTDFTGEVATRFLRAFDRVDDGAPWLLYVTPFAPHRPATPERAYADAPVSHWPRNRGMRERNRSDKPPWVRDEDVTVSRARETRRRQLRTLMSVDDVVGRLMELLGDLGERQDTLAFFSSDNGMFWGEHDLLGKRLPYREAVHIPMLMRWPGRVSTGTVNRQLVANIDVAPTALEAAGISPGSVSPPIDGRSLLSGASRDRMLLEYWTDPGRQSDIPVWAALWTKDLEYAEYYEGVDPVFREYYDLDEDPWQLRNLLGDPNPGNDPPTASLAAQLLADRRCRGTSGPSACP